MALSKWISLKSRHEKVHCVAARMLRSRLEAIAHYLPLAAGKAEENVEYVHQLRVWTRRADAAVDLCEDLLRKRDRGRLEERLDVLRDAAGAARDADVLLEKIAALKPGLGREHLLKEAQQRRREAQEPIVQAADKLRGGKELLEQLRMIAERIKRKRRRRPFNEWFDKWARQQLRPLVKKFFKRAKEDLADLAKLHKFRIAGKRLRYAWELVGGVFKKSTRQKPYRQLDRLQTQLGAINDVRNLIAAIERSLAAAKKRTLQTQLKRLLAAERRRLAAAQQSWQEAWTPPKLKRLQRQLDKQL